jgi:hypothetical protein
MKNYLKEAIVVAIFIMIAILKINGVMYSTILLTIALPLVYGFLIFFQIKSGSFKSDILLALIELQYKLFFVTALYFIAGDYPGRNYLYVASLCIAILYIIFALIKRRSYGNKAVCAITYINFFSFLFFAMR